MTRWQEIVKSRPLLEAFLSSTSPIPEDWPVDLADQIRPLAAELNAKVGTDWEDRLIFPLHQDCIAKGVFSLHAPSSAMLATTRMLFLLGYELASMADISLTAGTVVEMLQSAEVLAANDSADFRTNYRLRSKIMDIMEYGAMVRKNSCNVIPQNESSGLKEIRIPPELYSADPVSQLKRVVMIQMELNRRQQAAWQSELEPEPQSLTEARSQLGKMLGFAITTLLGSINNSSDGTQQQEAKTIMEQFARYNNGEAADPSLLPDKSLSGEIHEILMKLSGVRPAAPSIYPTNVEW